MQIIYTIGIYCFGLIMRIASVFNSKAKAWVEGRKNVYKTIPTKIENLIWFHCASLGEFDQGLPLMEKLKQQDPTIFILVTFFSPSGMQHYHKRSHKADLVMYLPLDTPSNAREFFRHFQPEKAFFVKYEFWSNFIFEAKKNKVLLYNVSGIFRPKHRYFKWYGGYFRKTLRAFEWFFVQNKESLELLESIGIVNVSISGDSRYDRVIENKKSASENEILKKFSANTKLLIIGSCWEEDEKILLPFIQNSITKTLIAPHNIDENHIKELQKQYPSAIRYTEYDVNRNYNSNILILDTIGQLSNAYLYGEIAYIGGGFSGSLHNILEPAVFGLPVIFGPKHSRFPEAQAFIDNGIGHSVSTSSDFAIAYNAYKENLNTLSLKTEKFILNNKGAADKIVMRLTSN